MDVLIQVTQLILSLSVLILLHEFGHYIAARMFHTRVEKFYLFFNPWFSLFKFKKGHTEYGLGWLPLGGYVKISGMIDESMDKEQMKQPPQPWEFRSKPAWQRLIIMLGGIIMNVLLGIFIYWMILFAHGEEYIPADKLSYGIAADSIGQEIGFRNGDKILAIDGKPVENIMKAPAQIIIEQARQVTIERQGQVQQLAISDAAIKKVIDNKSAEFISIRFPFMIGSFSNGSPAQKAGAEVKDIVVAINQQPAIFYDEVRPILQRNKGKEIQVSVLRNHTIQELQVNLGSDGLLGVKMVSPDNFFETEVKEYNLLSAFPAGLRKAGETLGNYVKQFGLIFNTEIQGYKHVGGFISIANAFGTRWDWLSFWSFTGFLSLALAFMNLLPIPALDGGHVLFTLYEMVTRRKPNEKFLEYAQVTGMVLLIALLVYANGNDLFGFFR